MTRTVTIGPLSAALLTAMVCACSSAPASDSKGTGGQGDGATTGTGNGSGIGLGSGGNLTGTGAGPSNLPDSGPPITSGDGRVIQSDAYGLVPLDQVISGGVAGLVSKACQGESVEPEPKPVALQLVVDVSSSMNAVARNTAAGGPNKYTITKDALVTALNTLPPDAAVGVTFYPNMLTTVNNAGPQDSTFCVNQTGNVPIDRMGAPGSAQRLAISRGLNAISIPDQGCGTPTWDAFSLGLQPLINLTTVSVNPDQKFMLLITDGMPTFNGQCQGWGVEQYPAQTAPIIQQIAAAKTQGIRTFVIGSPGSEASVIDGTNLRPWLSAAATAGGTATTGCSDAGPAYCHFDMSTEPDFAAGLVKALGTIASTMLVCNYSVPATGADGLPIDKAKVQIVYTDSTTSANPQVFLVAQSKDPTSCVNGWRYKDAAQTEIEICGSTCSLLMGNPEAKLDLAFSCTLSTGVF